MANARFSRKPKKYQFSLGKITILKNFAKIFFCYFRAFSVQKTYQKPFQNEVRTMKKSMSKTCWFLTSIFGGSGLDFGGSWASKSAALLAAPGVLDPTAFYACINILLGNALVGVRPAKIEVKTWPCWGHVGAMLAHFSLLGASRTHFSHLAALVVALYCFFDTLERSGGDIGALEAPFSRLLEAPRTYFSRLLCACVLALPKCSECNKTTVSLGRNTLR